jgi:adenylosuccinate lyase
VEPALQNNTLWDERDLTNSSCERIIFPEASILCDHILQLMTRVLEGLTINESRVRRNLDILHGINMAEAVMIDLTRRGMERQAAHEVVRVASMKALSEGRPLASVLEEIPGVRQYLSADEIRELLDPDRYIGTAVEQVDQVVAKLGPKAAKN